MSEILSNQQLNDLLWDCCKPGVMTYHKANVIKISHEALRKRDKRRLGLLQFVRDWLASKPRELIERIDAELKETAA